MNTFKRVKSVAVLTTIMLAASGCQQASQPEVAANAKQSAKKENSQVVAQSPGKPTAPIHMQYAVNGDLKAGNTIDVEVTLSAPAATSPIRGTLDTSAGLQMLSASKRLTVAPKAAGATGQPDVVSVMPEKDGVYYINVHASAEIDGSTQSRSFSIPLNVGNVDWEQHLKPEGRLETDENGDKVIVLPAQDVQ